MDTIDDFDVIEIDELLGKSHLSLSGRLVKALRGLAVTATVVATVSSATILASAVAPGPACDGTTPNDVEAIVVYRNLYVLRSARVQLEVVVPRGRVHEEALADITSPNALSSLEAVPISTTPCVGGRVSATARSSSEAEPDRLVAEVSHGHDTASDSSAVVD